MEVQKNAELLSERYERGTLSYLLLKPDLLSGTGYKVLQGQERAGFARCVRVIDNGRDKLVYGTDGILPLTQILPAMAPEEFCVVAAGISNAFQSVRSNGFLNAFNVVCDPDRIFVERGSCAVRLIYLPVAELNADSTDSFTMMKKLLAGAIAQNANLNNETVRQLGVLLADAGSTPEQLRAYLSEQVRQFEQSITVQSGTPTATIGGSGEIRNTTGLVSVTGAISNSGELTDHVEPMNVPEATKKEKFSSKLGKRQSAKEPAAIQDVEGGTEVLDDIFVPVIVLEGVGTSKKTELLINKQNYIIGKKAESVDGLIDFSNAVSRVHCRVSHNDGKSFITDLGSANGSFLNGKKLEPEKPAIINEGDKIKIADVTFVVKAI